MPILKRVKYQSNQTMNSEKMSNVLISSILHNIWICIFHDINASGFFQYNKKTICCQVWQSQILHFHWQQIFTTDTLYILVSFSKDYKYIKLSIKEFGKFHFLSLINIMSYTCTCRSCWDWGFVFYRASIDMITFFERTQQTLADTSWTIATGRTHVVAKCSKISGFARCC